MLLKVIRHYQYGVPSSEAVKPSRDPFCETLECSETLTLMDPEIYPGAQ